MKVGVLGSGSVGRALGAAFLQTGHEVMMGSRDKGNPQVRDWVASAGPKAKGGTFNDAARFGEWIVVATLGAANAAVIQAADPANLAGKIVIDVTNPLDFSQGFPPGLLPIKEGSSGAEIQALAPRAKVVKAFNTIGSPFMFRPKLPGGPPSMFIAGNDKAAKDAVTKLLKEFGFDETWDAGGIEASHYLEAMTIVWAQVHAARGKGDHAFRVIHS